MCDAFAAERVDIEIIAFGKVFSCKRVAVRADNGSKLIGLGLMDTG